MEVRGKQARLYVHGAEQPVLVISELKSGAIAHFRNLRVEPGWPGAGRVRRQGMTAS